MDALLIHYHEISLKGGNRPLFLRRLRDNIRAALTGLKTKGIRQLSDRLIVDIDTDAPVDEILARLERIPGIANIMPAFKTPAKLAVTQARILQEIKHIKFDTFRITTQRSDKSFETTSTEVDKILGAAVADASTAAVKLKDPELTIYVRIVKGAIYFAFKKLEGTGGLPVGISGTVVSLLSGGIDSPVASWMMMNRGARVVFLHFHSHPYLDQTSQQKAIELTELLNRHQQHSTLYLVPFGDIQRDIVVHTSAAHRVLIYRRFMMRIAEEIANREGASALITGENLGQVASQTITNMSAIEQVVTLPIFRPLIGMDKREIIDRAKKIGTYDTSIIPDQDCCQLFIPKHPATRTTKETLETIELDLDINKLVASALQKITIKKF